MRGTDAEYFQRILSSPTLRAHVLHGMEMARRDPLQREVERLYEQVMSYPEGYVWLVAHDAAHIDDFQLPDGDLLDRNRARKVVRMFHDHLLARRSLLRRALNKLQEGNDGQ